MSKLKGKKIAVLATDGFEHSELFQPVEALKEEGAEVEIISLKSGKIKSWKDDEWGEEIDVDVTLDSADGNDYDGLILPGGVINPDRLRRDKSAQNFVKSFRNGDTVKPIAAICHGPWMLAETGLAKDRKLTSYDSIKTDMINAGAKWVNEEVVVDDGIITSRSPEDLSAFISKTIEAID